MNARAPEQTHVRTAVTVFGITLLVTSGVSSLIPALPLLAQTFHVPIELSGLIVAAFALPGFFCIPLAGILSDRYGRRAVLLPSLLLFAAGGAACAIATSFTELLGCRVVQGIGSASLGILYNTIIADTWDGEARARMMSRNALVLGLGTAISPALGGALALLGWRMPFLLSLLALPLLCIAPSALLARPQASVSFRIYLGNVFRCLRAPETLRILGLGFGSSILLFGPVVTCFPLIAHQSFNAEAFDIGIIMAAASLISGIAAWRLGPLFSRLPARRLLSRGLVLYTLSFCAMPFMPSLAWLTLPLLLFGFAQGITIPLTALLLTARAPTGQRAALVSTNAMGMRLAQTLTPLAFILLAARTTPGVAVLAAVGVTGLMALLTAKIR